MLNLTTSPELGKLAWVVSIDLTNSKIQANLGTLVEKLDNGFVEGVWDDDFSKQNFHSCENFFGSGLLVHGRSVIIVPSTTLVDCIFLFNDGEKIYLSNSFIELLGHVGARPIDGHNYREEHGSISKGINDYERDIPISHPKSGVIKRVIFNPVEISSGVIKEITRPEYANFKNYHDYIEKIQEVIDNLLINACSEQREAPLKVSSTISRGYDSTFITALLSEHSVDACYTRKRSSSALPSFFFKSHTDDDGTSIANLLDIETSSLTFKNIDRDELYFLASTPEEPESVFFDQYLYIKNSESPYIIFTGVHGDKLWGKKLDEKFSTRDIRRTDTSGFGLSEPRLRSGFIHIPLPFIFARKIAKINAISNSIEMNFWSVGGDYDRPIPRRYLEETKKIPREMFGQVKKAAIDFYSLPKNTELRSEFLSYLAIKHKIYPMDIFLNDFRQFIVLAGQKFGIINRHAARDKLGLSYKMYQWAMQEVLKKEFLK
jgi:hypothetical protein